MSAVDNIDLEKIKKLKLVKRPSVVKQSGETINKKHPSFLNLVTEAIVKLNQKKGASRQEISKYITGIRNRTIIFQKSNDLFHFCVFFLCL